MRIFKTDSGLGYGEVAYFIETNNGKMLCIDENLCRCFSEKMYKVGNVYEFDDDEIDEIIGSKNKKKILKYSELYGNFLFNEFLKNLK